MSARIFRIQIEYDLIFCQQFSSWFVVCVGILRSMFSVETSEAIGYVGAIENGGFYSLPHFTFHFYYLPRHVSLTFGGQCGK